MPTVPRLKPLLSRLWPLTPDSNLWVASDLPVSSPRHHLLGNSILGTVAKLLRVGMMAGPIPGLESAQQPEAVSTLLFQGQWRTKVRASTEILSHHQLQPRESAATRGTVYRFPKAWRTGWEAHALDRLSRSSSFPTTLLRRLGGGETGAA